MLIGVVSTLDLLVPELLLGMGPSYPQPGHSVDHVHLQREPVDLAVESEADRLIKCEQRVAVLIG